MRSGPNLDPYENYLARFVNRLFELSGLERLAKHGTGAHLHLRLPRNAAILGYY